MRGTLQIDFVDRSTEVLLNDGTARESNLEWLARSSRAFDDLCEPRVARERKTRDDVVDDANDELRRQVERLTLQLKRERATVAALQDRLLREENTSRTLRQKIQSMKQRGITDMPALDGLSSPAKSQWVAYDRDREYKNVTNEEYERDARKSSERISDTLSTRSSIRASRAKKIDKRPPWNNDFTGIDESKGSNERQDRTVSSRETDDSRTHQNRRRRPRERPSWNNDFTEDHLKRQERNDDGDSRPHVRRREKRQDEKPARSRSSAESRVVDRHGSKMRTTNHREKSVRSQRRRKDPKRDVPRVEDAAADRPLDVHNTSSSTTPEMYANSATNALLPCRTCGRTFNEDALKRHARVCRRVNKASGRTRKFNAALKRAQAIAEQNNISQAKAKSMIRSSKRGGDSKPSSLSSFGRSGEKWREQSSALREAMRAARQYATAKKAGRDTSSLPTASYSEPSDYIPCPHCGRTFSQTAGERHIPHCAKSKKRRAFRGSRRR